MIVLSGDMGGTNTRLQLTDFGSSREMNIIKCIKYANNKFASFNDILDAFFQETQVDSKTIASVCVGVAGPIIKGAVKFTNLPWILHAEDIKKKLNIKNVKLINDFSAIGYGIETLKSEDLVVLQSGKSREDGIKAFIGAGSGLGVGFMTFDPDGYVVYPTEGGHVDFAPTDDIQIDLLRYLRKKFHRVSFERVLSGQGLVNIYHFVRDNKVYAEEENPELRFLIESDQEIDVAATIAEYAVKYRDIMSMRALDLFMAVYGAAVGNLALTLLPYGGIYVVGGIAPKLLKQIKRGLFMQMFGDKGRMSNLIKEVPVYVVLNTDVGLHGAAVYARMIASQKKE